MAHVSDASHASALHELGCEHVRSEQQPANSGAFNATGRGSSLARESPLPSPSTKGHISQVRPVKTPTKGNSVSWLWVHDVVRRPFVDFPSCPGLESTSHRHSQPGILVWPSAGCNHRIA